MHKKDQTVSIRIWASRDWIPLAQAVVEKSCPLFGLDIDRITRLTIAVEEIVMYLADTAPGTEVALELVPGGWQVTASLSFCADHSDLWAMNLYAKPDVAGDPDLRSLGLVLASRMTDRFSIRLEGGMVTLLLHQDLFYPSMEPVSGERLGQQGELTIESDPDSALVKESCIRAMGIYPARYLHHAFFKPGKLADMVDNKDLVMAVALTSTGEPAGTICWQGRFDSSLSFFGPYTFEQGSRCAALLTEHLIQRTARTRARGLFSGRATPELPKTDFEYLGSYGLLSDGESKALKVWYRHLGEDPGTSIWSHPDLVPFLEETYQRLVLMRHIRTTRELGETLPDRSVLSARLRPELSEALLVPMVGGADMAACLLGHVQTLEEEGYTHIFFQLDLASGWQASLAGAAFKTGFKPRLVLPYGGKSDLVVFQYDPI